MTNYVFCIGVILLGMCVTLFGQDASEKFEKPIDPGGTLSNRVLVAKLPRRPMPEYITPEQVRELSWKGGETVKNACLSCPEPDTELFPVDARIVFINCNLDNVLIPTGCKLVDCLYKPQEQKRFVACEVSIAGKTEVRDVLLVKGSKTETTGKTVDGETCTVVKIKEAVK